MTWNGEEIIIHDDYGGFAAALDGYDPTPFDEDHPATGIHSRIAHGDSKDIAACELVQEIYDMSVPMEFYRPMVTE